MSESDSVKLSVCGISCRVSTDDSEQLLSMAQQLEDRMRSVLDGTGFSASQAAVFAALQYMQEAEDAKAAAAKYRDQIRTYLEDAARAKGERDAANRELERLRKAMGEQ